MRFIIIITLFRIHSVAVNHIGFATRVKLYICQKEDKLWQCHERAQYVEAGERRSEGTTTWVAEELQLRGRAAACNIFKGSAKEDNS
jgi:hypothetical protein